VSALTTTEWTVVAKSSFAGRWRAWYWEGGFDAKHILAGSARGDVVLMRRHVRGGVELVARLSTPAWHKVWRWLAHHPMVKGARR